MPRLSLIIGAVALLALQPLAAEAQSKNKARSKNEAPSLKDKSKGKACADRPENGVASRDRCSDAKSANFDAPIQRQIGRDTSFGLSGSPFQGGATGNSLRPAPLPNKTPMGGTQSFGGAKALK
jgi:hypothetical protein